MQTQARNGGGVGPLEARAWSGAAPAVAGGGGNGVLEGLKSAQGSSSKGGSQGKQRKWGSMPADGQQDNSSPVVGPGNLE